jgi:hypothetical protein
MRRRYKKEWELPTNVRYRKILTKICLSFVINHLSVKRRKINNKRKKYRE